MTQNWKGFLKRVDGNCWEISESYGDYMRVPGRIFASEELLDDILSDNALQQVANVASLPGIVRYSLAMPDIHWGYGFPIGGVAVTDPDRGGVISPGGVGYDINCGVRILRTNLSLPEVKRKLPELADSLYKRVPSGVGSKGPITLDNDELNQVLSHGSAWAVMEGYGWDEDLEYTEAGGALPGADARKVSAKAQKRGFNQLGTLGSGNHFLEIQVVDAIYDEKVAEAYGLELGMVCVAIHSGSRGLGHQVCSDYLSVMNRAVKDYEIDLPDRQLACAPLNSREGRDYSAAMAGAANYAWANRQCLTHYVRKITSEVFGASPEDLGMGLVYDVAHNIAKWEKHEVDGEEKTLCVHRKGATRSFPPGHPDVPERYREAGQPLLVPGDMGTFSYMLAGLEGAMLKTFGSACHGAGRRMSRSAAKKSISGKELKQELHRQGIIVRAASNVTIAEEAPEAYKDVNLVVGATEGAGLAARVARMRPLAVVKG